MSRLLAFVSIVMLVVGCSSDAATPGTNGPNDTSPADTSTSGPDDAGERPSETSGSSCTPGRAVSCPCPGGEGIQRCQPSGTFGACQCSRDASSDGGQRRRDTVGGASDTGDAGETMRDGSRIDGTSNDAGCECSDASLKCCDGCHLLPKGERCSEKEGIGGTCKVDGCGGVARTERKFAVCNGTSPRCPNNKKWRTVDTEQCGPLEVCRGTTCELDSRICE